MKVAEKFISVNGEGQRAGELAVFVRFTGCNLCCSYCDTRWANEADAPYDKMTPKEIYAYIKDTGVKNVTLTGGEPLLHEGMGDLLSILAKDSGLRIEIETNGSVDITPFCLGNNISFTLDYKLPGSGVQTAMNTDNYMYLSPADTVKFVTGSLEDLDRASEIIEKHGLCGKCKVYISPVFGRITPSEIVDYMAEHKLNDVRLQLQLHKYIWNPDKRGV